MNALEQIIQRKDVSWVPPLLCLLVCVVAELLSRALDMSLDDTAGK